MLLSQYIVIVAGQFPIIVQKPDCSSGHDWEPRMKWSRTGQLSPECAWWALPDPKVQGWIYGGEYPTAPSHCSKVKKDKIPSGVLNRDQLPVAQRWDSLSQVKTESKVCFWILSGTLTLRLSRETWLRLNWAIFTRKKKDSLREPVFVFVFSITWLENT